MPAAKGSSVHRSHRIRVDFRGQLLVCYCAECGAFLGAVRALGHVLLLERVHQCMRGAPPPR